MVSDVRSKPGLRNESQKIQRKQRHSVQHRPQTHIHESHVHKDVQRPRQTPLIRTPMLDPMTLVSHKIAHHQPLYLQSSMVRSFVDLLGASVEDGGKPFCAHFVDHTKWLHSGEVVSAGLFIRKNVEKCVPEWCYFRMDTLFIGVKCCCIATLSFESVYHLLSVHLL